MEKPEKSTLETLLDLCTTPDHAGSAAVIPADAVIGEAERILADGHPQPCDRQTWLSFLDITRKPVFLQSLSGDTERRRWADLAFAAIRHTGYDLRQMMEHRVAEHPNQVLFRDMSTSSPVDWTYEQVYHHIREIATVFHRLVPGGPRVALYTENCFEGACSDLACLMFNIFDTPLSPHFKQDVLLAIFDELSVTIALADTAERLETLAALQKQTRTPFTILSLQPATQRTRDIPYLVEEAKKTGRQMMDDTLSAIPGRPLDEVATTMFTSGSTGLPKGVSFSIYNIVSKRFARAAALPEVGNETFLCYLPLFHTFGRYLEMTGAIFWSGTYIFAGNTSAETLLSLFPRMNPSGFISIPLRWQELYDRCQERIAGVASPDLRQQAVREVVGHRLHWGLSAAGYLDPAVFRFFNHYGIHLNSGFGMTEATGGITMTPPGMYREYSVGVPLPGVRTRLTENSELELSGHYIGRYLEVAGPGNRIPYPLSEEADTWLPTGDVFRVSDDGYFEIIDRVKDIYKNNRGQTVAPQVIEKKFFKVPGIKRVFLVGDNRPYNVLLIVPDPDDALFRSLKGDNLTEYLRQIVMAANSDVAPFERVINFAVPGRDFSADLGEITPKGSYNRKVIENNFRELIDSLYLSTTVTIDAGNFTVQIPKWFYRDLGILETDIRLEKGRLVNRQHKTTLPIRKLKNDWYRIGDFRYRIGTPVIDLGLLSRQPRIWAGNAALIAFCPVREGWDFPLKDISPSVFLHGFRVRPAGVLKPARRVREQQLNEVNALLFRICYSTWSDALEATGELGGQLTLAEPRMALLIRYRLEALAYHPSEEIRCMAYRLILLKTPNPEEIRNIPSFIESGLTFLNETSIREIAASNFGKHRLDALKQRLHWYRSHLRWPAARKHRRAFEDVLGLLYNFALLHPDYYVPVRAELSRWILHRQDPKLSAKAESFFYSLAGFFEGHVDRQAKTRQRDNLAGKVVFENGIPEREQRRISTIFRTTTFLEESIILTFREQNFDPASITANGIWVLRLLAFQEFKHYRLSVNTIEGKHYDLHMVMSEDPSFTPRPETFYWLASLAGFPLGPAVAPMLGSSRPGLGVLTTQYIGGLSAWDKMRELSEIHRSSGFVAGNAWRKIFIKSFAVIFRAWQYSGQQIVPGAISPSNIAIPEMDFRESAVILSLSGWTKYRNTLSLVGPMLQDFYCKTASIYPWCRNQLSVSWIFDGCVEALGKQEALQFFSRLQADLPGQALACFDGNSLDTHLAAYLDAAVHRHYLPLALYSAIDQYQEWFRMNPLTTANAREETCLELLELYRLRNHPEVVRYFLYRHTYFSHACAELQTAFDRLLERMFERPDGLAIQLAELSDLQSCLSDTTDRAVFSRMVFPRLQGEQGFDIIRVGDDRQEHMVVRFSFHDSSGHRYILREPVAARETGQLYQLFFRENYPKEISDTDHQYVLADDDDQVVGGITYRFIEDRNILVDGIVVTSALQGKGIGSAMMEHFFASMAARGVEVIRAHFLFGNYYMKHLFEIDKNWGALIKKLK